MMTLFRIAACFPIAISVCKLIPGLKEALDALGGELTLLGLAFSAAYVGAEIFIWRSKVMTRRAEKARRVQQRQRRLHAPKVPQQPAE